MRDITSDDLARARHYTPLVKRVVIDPMHTISDFDSYAWSALLAPNIGPLNFPNLASVQTWQRRLLNTPHDPPPIYRLLGKSLRSLRIGGVADPKWYPEGPDDRDNPENLIAIYTNLDLRSPRLENLSVTVHKFHDDIASPLMESICGLHNLLHCTLEGIFVTSRVLSHLASLSFLQTLSIRTRTIDFMDGLSDTLSAADHPFPKLQRASLFFECMPICTELIHAIRSSKLDQVTVIIAEPVSAGELVAFGSALSDHPSSGTFEILDMVLGELTDNAEEVEPLPSSAFLSFASLHRLREITIRGTCYFNRTSHLHFDFTQNLTSSSKFWLTDHSACTNNSNNVHFKSSNNEYMCLMKGVCEGEIYEGGKAHRVRIRRGE